ncbi:MAG: FAD-dependent oxidoreductase [Oscillochloris sp.]|nr:FAD-dependent oxidoreductase [Oscillochloris sp.]
MAYDTIIVGAGVAGLTLAALLANDGRKVLVLERELIPGGQFATIRPAPPVGPHYRFDVAIAPLIGFEAGGLYDQITQRLGLRFPVLPITPALALRLPDRDLVAAGNPQQWQHERRTTFPEQVLEAESFWHSQEAMAALFMRSITPQSLLHLPSIGLLAHRERTVAHEIRRRRLTDPALRAVLDGLTLLAAGLPGAACPWPAGSLALDLPRGPIFYAAGGNGSIAATLLDGFIRDGGEIRYSAAVTGLLATNGRIGGVQLGNGTTIESRRVVYSGDLATLPALLGPHAPATLSRRIARLPELWGSYGLVVGLDARVMDVATPILQIVINDPNLPIADGNLAFISTHPAADQSRAPGGMRAVTLTTPVAPGPRWEDLANRAELLRERLLSALEQALPGAQAAIHLAEPISPQPPRRYGLRTNNSIADGLWILDARAFPGPQILAAGQSALHMYRRLRYRRAP